MALQDVNGLLLQLRASNKQQLLQQLTCCVRHLILHDFAALVQLLYRVDVSETQLKTTLSLQPQADAAEVIAAMLLERQMEKQQIKKKFSTRHHADDEERW